MRSQQPMDEFSVAQMLSFYYRIECTIAVLRILFRAASKRSVELRRYQKTRVSIFFRSIVSCEHYEANAKP
jgi:hypothetical protein